MNKSDSYSYHKFSRESEPLIYKNLSPFLT